MVFLGYYFGVGALGLVIGYLIALSASPVVGTVLPLLFSLLGGAGAVYVAKLDLRDPQGRAKLNLAGISLFCFALAIIVSSFLTIRYRDGVPPLPLGAKNLQTPEQIEHFVQLAKLRRQLQNLRATDDEIVRILRSAPTVTVSPVDDASKMAEKANRIAKAIGPINKRVNADKVADQDLKKKIENWKAAMTFVERALPEAAKQLQSEPEVASRLLGFEIDYLTHMTQQLPGGKDAVWNVADYEKLAYDTSLLGALLETTAVLDAHRIRFLEQTTSPPIFKEDTTPTRLQQQVAPFQNIPTKRFAIHRTPFDFYFPSVAAPE